MYSTPLASPKRGNTRARDLVQLHEIADGSWSAAGQIRRFTDIAHSVTVGEPPPPSSPAPATPDSPASTRR